MVALTREELLRLLAAARAHSERDWLMILVAFHHGLRASEVVAITRDAVQDGFLTVQRLKGSSRTVQALVTHGESLLSERSALLDYAAKSNSVGPIFDISRQHFWRILQRHGKTAKLPAHKCHPHALKHSIAMQTIHSAGVENVRQHLGHKSLNSTGEYLKVSDEQASAAVERALKGVP